MSAPPVPPGMDPDVFAALPLSLQLELCENFLASITSEEELTPALPPPPSFAPRPSRPLGDQTSTPPPPPSSAASRPVLPLTFLTYNVWFDDLERDARLQAVMDIVDAKAPTFLGLQEVTVHVLPALTARLSASGYHTYTQPSVMTAYGVMLCSKVPLSGVTHFQFKSSAMGRELLYGVAALSTATGDPIDVVVGTTHLESVTGAAERRTEERKAQFTTSFGVLDGVSVAGPCVRVLMGDVNWTDPVRGGKQWDGPPPVPPHWADAWTVGSSLPTGSDGFTYDSKSNPMLAGTLRYRSDRVYVTGGAPRSAELVGMTALPGLTRRMENSYTGAVTHRPVLPSDHYGLYVCVVAGEGDGKLQAATAPPGKKRSSGVIALAGGAPKRATPVGTGTVVDPVDVDEEEEK